MKTSSLTQPASAAHTPTPWTAKHAESADSHHFDIRSADDSKVCEVGFSSTYGTLFRSQAAANAAFIVRAVNSHDALVAALEQIEDEINRTGSPSCDGWDKARAALAKAKGGAL